jgi:hypothetical protein
MTSDETMVELPGPIFHANWRAFENKEALITTVEYPLYTDARITGEMSAGFGPYKFLNTVPSECRPGVLNPSIVLRADIYLENNLPRMTATDTAKYHGGLFQDEIAALVSLCLGVRVKAAGESRRFDPKGDPLGRPQATRFRSEPTMNLGDRHLKLPGSVGSHSLEGLHPIKLLPKLSPEDTIGIVRAARFYQDALWIAESEPALAWLMFVSALEVGASIWHKGYDTPVSKLQASKPELYKLLEKTGIEGLAEDVAAEIVHTLGVTKKFIEFSLNFLPEPPESRPAVSAQIDWSRSSMKTALGKIYGYRSDALHGGIPFPGPMSFGASMVGDCLAEKPMGLACATLHGVWLAKDTPMLIHMFEYITRGVLVNWLSSLKAS